MKSFLACLLFGWDTPPSPMWNDAPMWAKEFVTGLAADVGLTHPLAETPAWDYFQGVYYVWQRRYIGKPLPYPADPIFGK